MKRMKKQKKYLPKTPTEYPTGLFLQTETGYYYVVSPVKRYRITTKRVLDSWSPQRVIQTTESAVEKYKIAAKMKFRNGSLIYNYADAKLYLISEGLRRHITSPDVMDRLSLDKSQAIRVSQAEVSLHEEGAPLN